MFLNGFDECDDLRPILIPKLVDADQCGFCARRFHRETLNSALDYVT
jgi:hypothetical protein